MAYYLHSYLTTTGELSTHLMDDESRAEDEGGVVAGFLINSHRDAHEQRKTETRVK